MKPAVRVVSSRGVLAKHLSKGVFTSSVSFEESLTLGMELSETTAGFGTHSGFGTIYCLQVFQNASGN